jgi:hypothetical protein
VRGEDVEVAGLGVFKNGSKKLVTPDDAEAFRNFHSRPVVDVEATSARKDGIAVYKNELGPTITEAFKDTDWMTSDTVDMERDEDGEWVVKESSPPPKPPTSNPTPTARGGDK